MRIQVQIATKGMKLTKRLICPDDEVNGIPGVSVSVGKPGQGKDVKYKLRYANEKSKDVLGMRYLSKEAVAKAMVADVQQKGWAIAAKQ